MKCCAVIDTNVLLSALISKREDAATVQVIRAMLAGRFTPLYHLEKANSLCHRDSRLHLCSGCPCR